MSIRDRINRLEDRILSRRRRIFILDTRDTHDVTREIKRLRGRHGTGLRFLVLEDTLEADGVRNLHSSGNG